MKERNSFSSSGPRNTVWPRPPPASWSRHTGDMESQSKLEPPNGHSRPLDIVPSTEEKMTDRGAFFIPYLIFLFACGIPVFFLETSLGQYTSEGGITCWRKICPLFEGIGYATQVIVALLNIYYIIVLAWAIFYLSNSFTWDLPWASCNNTWNTNSCMAFQRGNSSINHHENTTSPVIEFWEGVTLPGASRGIHFYLYPDLGRLSDPQVWMDAGTQIFFSYAICIGCLTALGSYNKYNNNCYKDCLSLCFLNSGTSFVAGFAIFSILGFMSYEQNIPISEVAESGPGLAFIAYPRAVAMMPFSPLWACCFFIMIVFLGLDSEFVCVESLVTAVVDMYPSTFRRKYRRELFILGVAVVSFFLGLIMLTEGTFAFALIKYSPLKYNNEYVYPWWGYGIGWILALSSMLCIPVWVALKLYYTPGTLRERLVLLTTPSTELPKTRQEQEKLLAIFAADGDSLHQKAPPTKEGYFPVDEKDSHC
ncbi:hypothetical protein PAMP_020036 [Pampus punctatissimus]